MSNHAFVALPRKGMWTGSAELESDLAAARREYVDRSSRATLHIVTGEEQGWDGALSTIVEDPLEQVFVAVYDITREDETALDRWEGADLGLYRKTRVRVSTMTGEVVGWAYVLDAYEGGLPSASYLGVLANAAEAADAPADYVAALRRRPCRSTGL